MRHKGDWGSDGGIGQVKNGIKNRIKIDSILIINNPSEEKRVKIKHRGKERTKIALCNQEPSPPP